MKRIQFINWSFAIGSLLVFFCFQNCAPSINFQESASNTIFQNTAPDAPALVDNNSNLPYDRLKLYPMQYVDPNQPKEAWDYYWNGSGTPANIKSNNMRFESNIDDDANKIDQYGRIFKPSGLATGYVLGSDFYTADRVSGNLPNAANIWTRDPYLSAAEGMTIEFSIKILPQSHENAYSVIYFDEGGGLGMHISAHKIRWGGQADAFYDLGMQSLNHDFTKGFNKIRILRWPNSNEYTWYLNDEPARFGRLDPDQKATRDDREWAYPRIFLGDNYVGAVKINGADRIVNAAYSLDYVKYRRGVAVPGHFPALSLKSVPPLPRNANLAEEDSMWRGPHSVASLKAMIEDQNIQIRNSPTYQPDVNLDNYNDYTQVNLRGDWNTDPVSGAMTVGSGTFFRSGKAFENFGVPGLTTARSYTVETELKLLPDSDDDALVLEIGDVKGDATIVFNKKEIRAVSSYLDVDQVKVPVNLTDAFHKIRIVRKCESSSDVQCLLFYVYLDDNPSPVISDLKLFSDLYPFLALSFGDLAYPNESAKPKALVKYVRWHSGAYAPEKR